ncbi:hypothetical protein HaLaN_14238 [Haematococcus lacustris]|uniref:Uncharacterized protein n=1 Tax=Haematococcus lacustris TaxID=44745 RepID=A0A699ZEI2_HAELA|nr:hypothetical protein HaLaN_14238 [Haematococcus lacustris]
MSAALWCSSEGRRVEELNKEVVTADTWRHRQGVRCLGRAIAGQDAALLVVDASQGLAGLRLSLDAGQGLLWEHMCVEGRTTQPYPCAAVAMQWSVKRGRS